MDATAIPTPHSPHHGTYQSPKRHCWNRRQRAPVVRSVEASGVATELSPAAAEPKRGDSPKKLTLTLSGNRSGRIIPVRSRPFRASNSSRDASPSCPSLAARGPKRFDEKKRSALARSTSRPSRGGSPLASLHRRSLAAGRSANAKLVPRARQSEVLRSRVRIRHLMQARRRVGPRLQPSVGGTTLTEVRRRVP
jgi:hypothetical protein